MSKPKLLKQLDRQLEPPTGERAYTPAVLSDSKGKWLQRKISNTLESNLKWWTKSGETSEKGYKWLKSNIRHKTRKHGQIWLYVWYDSAVEKAAEYLGKIKELVKQYPGCRITFLEIPVYSISEYNKNKDHKTPENFKEQDKQLETQIYKLNEKIRNLNKDELTYSPLFTTDIIHNSKTIKNKRTRSSTTRKTFSFWLYADGIHTGPLLAKV
ncbi:unnamed protein product [Mytilus coruscus]|uniref:Uncharacterized protein n=1 Tax=Mytilus coruscus TaxID=42192 RepID=A0A6J7ZVM2_MYTCO|nr:unnamed protein product [Mytilus coruscus]